MRQNWSGREAMLVALLSAVAVCILFFEILFGNRNALAFSSDDPRVDIRPWAGVAEGVPDPVNLVTPDIVGFILPGLMRERQLQEQGSDGYWDDSQVLGYPIVANMPFPRFSPLAWLVAGLDPVSALDVMLALHLAIALFLAYRLCRMFGLDPPAATLGAVGFALSGWMSVRWHLSPLLYTAAFWPGQLAALEWLRQGKTRRAILEGGIFTGLLLVAGFPQVGIVLSMGSLLFLFFDRELRRLRPFLALGASIVLGIALAAPQLALSVSAYRQSLRSTSETQELTAERGLPPGSLFGVIFPDFFGDPVKFGEPDSPAQTMEEWLPQRLFFEGELQNNVVENAVYPGIVVLLLLALIRRRGVDRRVKSLLWVSCLVFFGTMIFPWLASHVSWFAQFAAGNVKRALAIPLCALPLAAALSYQALLDRKGRSPLVAGVLLILLLVSIPWIFSFVDDAAAPAFARDLAGQAVRQSVLVVLALIALSLAVRGGRFGRFLPAVLLAIDLGWLALSFNPFQEDGKPFAQTPALETLSSVEGRTAVFASGLNVLPPTAAALHGMRSVQGMVPMIPSRAAELLSVVEGPRHDPSDPRIVRPFQSAESLSHPILDLLGVDTVIHADPELRAASGLPDLLVSEEEGIAALVRDSALPRAFIVGGVRVVPGKEERLALLGNRQFPIRETVLLEQDISLELPEEGEYFDVAEALHSPETHDLRVDAPFPGILVLAEGWAPGWTGVVDGKDVEVLVVDHALMGLPLTNGPHVVRFRYEPPGLNAALVMAGLAAAVLLLMLVLPAGRVRTT